jgi:hypothetical protein
MGEVLRLDNPYARESLPQQAVLESEPTGIGAVYLRLTPSRMND